MLKFAIYICIYVSNTKNKEYIDSHDTIEIIVKRYTAS